MQPTELQHNIPHARNSGNQVNLILLLLTFPHTALHSFLRWQFPKSLTTSTSKRHGLSVSKSTVSRGSSSKQQKSPHSFPHFAAILFRVNRNFFLSIDFLRVSLNSFKLQNYQGNLGLLTLLCKLGIWGSSYFVLASLETILILSAIIHVLFTGQACFFCIILSHLWKKSPRTKM